MLVFRQILSEEELRQVQQLRYQVYCIEKKFLSADNYPDGIETDEYDQHSIHLVAISENNGKIAGTLRLILNSEHRFPVEKHCNLYQPIEDRKHSVEFSRLIVEKEYRKDFAISIMMGLSREAYRYLLKEDIEHCYAVLEVQFLRMLKRLGIQFRPIGSKEWCFNTENQSVYASVSECEKQLKENNAKFYAYLHEQ